MTGSLARALGVALRSPGGRAGAALLAGLALAALIGPWFLPDPSAIPAELAGPLAPGTTHPFGTDQLGRDVLARTVSGARISLTVGIFAVAVAVTLGTLVGLVAGYAGGLLDAVLMRLVDAALAIPRPFILLLLVLVWDRIPLPVLILVIRATGWFSTRRLDRGALDGRELRRASPAVRELLAQWLADGWVRAVGDDDE